MEDGGAGFALAAVQRGCELVATELVLGEGGARARSCHSHWRGNHLGGRQRPLVRISLHLGLATPALPAACESLLAMAPASQLPKQLGLLGLQSSSTSLKLDEEACVRSAGYSQEKPD
eukprot:s221_g10.t1